MSLVALCADPHLWNHTWHGGLKLAGINRRAQDCLATFSDAIDVALKHGCSAFVVLGDVFDGPRPEPPLIAAVQEELARCRAGGCEPVLLKGNHDQASNAVGDHALAALDPVATIVDTQRVISIGDFDLWCMSFGPDMVAELKRLADEEVTSDHPVALCMHLGIAGPGTPPWLKASGISLEDLEQAMARSGCAVCFAGDWHRHERYLNDTAIQVGTLCPAGFDDAGLDGYGRVVLWEPGVGVQAAVEIPGPRFLKVTSLESIDLGVTPPPYVQLICSPAKLAVVEELLTMALKGGAIAGYKLVLDDAEQVAQARTAAEGARSARNLDEALERYVAAMPLNEDVDREELLAGCRALLGLRRKEPEGKETES